MSTETAPLSSVRVEPVVRQERTEGWGSVVNSRDAHYFRGHISLCRRWMAIGSPRWGRFQELGREPTRGSGTCKACWKKVAKELMLNAANEPTATDKQGD